MSETVERQRLLNHRNAYLAVLLERGANLPDRFREPPDGLSYVDLQKLVLTLHNMTKLRV